MTSTCWPANLAWAFRNSFNFNSLNEQQLYHCDIFWGPSNSRRGKLLHPAATDNSHNLTDFTYFALQHGTTRSKTLAYEVDVGFEFKK